MIAGSKKTALGWREWASLPDFSIPWIKAKIDTGARTSALHAFALERFTEQGAPWVQFRIHPLQRNNDLVALGRAPLVDERVVRDSGGHEELRPVIRTIVRLREHELDCEITLTDRDSMGFRLLVGRTAMRGRFVVDPQASYLLGKKPRSRKKARL